MTVTEINSTISAACAFGGFVFAFLAYLKARRVPALEKAVDDVATQVKKVEHATNGMKQELEDSARRQGFRAGVAQESEKAAAVAAGVADERAHGITSGKT